jgi:hypothetical protein
MTPEQLVFVGGSLIEIFDASGVLTTVCEIIAFY